MASKLDHALALSARGLWLFPIRSNGKKPAHKGWQQEATRDPEQLARWFSDGAFNLGVFTSRLGESDALVCVDVDNKGSKRGDDVIFALELEGFDLPDTLEVASPNNGRHLYFRVPDPLRQGANVLGPGVDSRSRGGFVLGPGSSLDGREYEIRGDRPIAPAPDWLVARLGRSRDRTAEPANQEAVQVDRERALSRVVAYLTDDAPLAVEGDAGDQTAYRVAARVKDFGLSQLDCLNALAEHWNPRCLPPWATNELAEKVRNAYAYGLEIPGAAAPEAQFTAVEPEPEAPLDTVEHPFDELNKHHAFVLAGGGAHILWETTDATGRFDLQHLALGAYHSKHAPFTMTVGKKTSPITEEWMRWKGRRGYDGLVFRPEQPAPERFYNLWRGFAVEPWPADQTPPPEAQRALDLFLEHARENVCRADESLFQWLMSWFAHLVQRPWEKPSVALVLKGEKGVGKNVLIETVGALLGGHFLLTSNRRYLIGNFNGHLENCLFFALDEAFWSGDKQAEGTLKDLITGASHQIEHKGKEPYSVDNRTRIAIIGNEDWLVPASHDERRFAVFDVGNGRKQDRDFFHQMREGMVRDGARLLLTYLRNYHGGGDTGQPPKTGALLDQKHSSLPPLHQWWHTCLEEGRISYSDFGEDWPDTISRQRLRDAFGRYAKGRGVNRYLPDEREFGKLLKKACPDVGEGRSRKEGYTYKLPGLSEARAAWDAFMGQSAAGAWGVE